MRKIFILFLLPLFFFNFCYAQDKKFSGSFYEENLTDIVSTIKSQTGTEINYNPEWIKGFKFSGNFSEVSVPEVLRTILKNKGITFFQLNQSYFLMPSKNISKDIAYIIGAGLSEAEFLSDSLNSIIKSYDAISIFRLEGKIINALTEEPLIGVTIHADDKAYEAISEIDGSYKLDLPAGKHNIKFSLVGFENENLEVFLNGNLRTNIKMFEKSTRLDEVVVVANDMDERLNSVQSSIEIVKLESIKNLPTFLGEVDVVKTILALPGVTTVGEGSGGFNVRGGSIDENLILMDGIPIFNSSHLFGFFSVFNSDVVDEFKLYKGGIPASFGGRTSSVLDVSVKNGGQEKLKYSGSVGLISSKLTIDGPILKDKSSFLIGLRAAYPTHIMRKFPDRDIQQSKANFQDINLKYSHTFTPKDQFSLSSYFSADEFRFAQDTTYKWSNRGLSLRWKHRLNKTNSLSFQAVYSSYRNKINGVQENSEFNYEAGVEYVGVNAFYLTALNSNDLLEFGVESNLYCLKSGSIEPSSPESIINKLDLGVERALETSIYTSLEKSVNNLAIQAGLRVSSFINIGPEIEREYQNPEFPTTFEIIDSTLHSGLYNGSIWVEPRLSVRYSLDSRSNLKLGYNHMRQNIHVISITSSIAPSDYWKLTSPNIPTSITDQFSIGYFREFNKFNASTEGFYKLSQNMLDYRDGGDIFLNPNVETEVIFTNGRSYGIEFKLEKQGRLNGWLSYTYFRSLRQSDYLSTKEWYSANFDKPHNFNINIIYKIRKRLSIAANFTFSTGRPITGPSAVYSINDQLVVHYSERNSQRIPNYHRADISLSLDGNYKKSGFKSRWVFSVYNIYGRKNPYSIYFDTIAHGLIPQGYKLSILGNVFPSLSYSFTVL